jgi:retron-type reverse transcriptase
LDYWSTIKQFKTVVSNPNASRAQPLRRVLISKIGNQTRPLGVPTLWDRSVQL